MPGAWLKNAPQGKRKCAIGAFSLSIFWVEFEIQGKLDLEGMSAKKKSETILPESVNFAFQNTKTQNW
jgi:hypothetical protein